MLLSCLLLFLTVIWSVQGPGPDNDEDSDSEMEDLGDGIEVPKRNIERLRSAWRYLDCPGKCGLPAAAGKLSPLQVSKCWYAQRESPVCIALKRPSTTFGKNTTVLRATTTSLETDIEVSEPFLSDSDSDSSSNSDDDGLRVAGAACDEVFVHWGGGCASIQSEESSASSEEMDEGEVPDSVCAGSENRGTPRDSELCPRLLKLQQRIFTLNEDKITHLQKVRAVSLESDRLEAECQDLRSKLQLAGKTKEIQLEDCSGNAMNHMLRRMMQLNVAGELRLRQLSDQERHERESLAAKAAGTSTASPEFRPSSAFFPSQYLH